VRDETLAEALLSSWRKVVSFKGRSSVSTWLLAIARYKALSARRRSGCWWQLSVRADVMLATLARSIIVLYFGSLAVLIQNDQALGLHVSRPMTFSLPGTASSATPISRLRAAGERNWPQQPVQGRGAEWAGKVVGRHSVGPCGHST
jgi:Sigma-70 region 2